VNSFAEQVKRLQDNYQHVEIHEVSGGARWILVSPIELPRGWNQPSTSIVFVAPAGYPMAQPDCFWADGALRLVSGAMPASSGLNNGYGGPDQRLWFSYHPSSWNPNTDDLVRYVNIICKRLNEPR
jgi:hypothetical protein